MRETLVSGLESLLRLARDLRDESLKILDSRLYARETPHSGSPLYATDSSLGTRVSLASRERLEKRESQDSRLETLSGNDSSLETLVSGLESHTLLATNR